MSVSHLITGEPGRDTGQILRQALSSGELNGDTVQAFAEALVGTLTQKVLASLPAGHALPKDVLAARLEALGDDLMGVVTEGLNALLDLPSKPLEDLGNLTDMGLAEEGSAISGEPGTSAEQSILSIPEDAEEAGGISEAIIGQTSREAGAEADVFHFAPNFGRAIVVPWADSLKESDLASEGPTTFDDLLTTIEDLGPAMALGHPSANALEKLAAAIQGVNDFS